MEAAFAWLGYVFEWLGRWIPRLTIVNTTHGWVKFVGGSKVKSGGAGPVWHWPMWTNLVVFPIERDSLQCPAQAITLSSGETVLVVATVVYEVKEIEKLVAQTPEPQSTIADLTMGAVLYVMEGINSWDEIRQLSVRAPRARDTELNRRLRDEVQRALEPYGVNVLMVMLQNKAKARVYKLVND
jgi:regulator of protease activity HflC (stomatin/prohibitin superfamily)